MASSFIESQIVATVREALDEAGYLLGLDEQEAQWTSETVAYDVTSELLSRDNVTDMVYALAEKCYREGMGLESPDGDVVSLGPRECETRECAERTGYVEER